jgi:hypothetical protein
MQEHIEDKRRRLPLLERSLLNAVSVAFDPFRDASAAAGEGAQADIPDPTPHLTTQNDSRTAICRTEIYN